VVPTDDPASPIVTDFLSGLAGRLTDRWLTGVFLPGALFVAVVAAAVALGQHDALNPTRLVDHVRNAVSGVTGAGPSSYVLAVLGLIAAAILTGMVLSFLAESVVQRALVASKPRFIVDARRKRTIRRWERRDQPPAARYAPARVTVAGDRLRLIGERADAQYGLSIVDVWPRLWILISADTRSMVTAAYQGYATALIQIAWGAGCLLLSPVWWPAAVIAVAAVAWGMRRARETAGSLAVLIESTVDTHQAQLAAAVGVDVPSGRITPNEGNTINDILNKRG
jgi:hypothetical protein